MRLLPLLSICLLTLLPTLTRAHEPAAEMATAARQWLDALTPEQRKAAVYPLADAERENWHYVPKDRAGVVFKTMTAPQQTLARALLRSGLSQRGYAKTEAIIALEAILRELEQAAHRDTGLYYVTIFGTPAPDKSWGWRFEGHHVSINFTIAGGHHVSVTPTFFGANPARVLAGPHKDARALADEEDLGRALVLSFAPEQRAKVIFTTNAPREIITKNDHAVKPLAPVGLPVAQMTPAQSAQLLALLKVYATNYRAELAEAELTKIMAAGWEKVHFAWGGSTEVGQPHYYRIQGPTFVIEYDNVQNKANHIHTVWRDFDGDFGRNLLREHHEAAHK
jgi:hypothetical protein